MHMPLESPSISMSHIAIIGAGRDRRGGFKYRNRIPIEIVHIFEKHGFIWGGRRHHFDTMHFSIAQSYLCKTVYRLGSCARFCARRIARQACHIPPVEKIEQDHAWTGCDGRSEIERPADLIRVSEGGCRQRCC